MGTTTALIDLNGTWESGGIPGPVVAVSGAAITIDMSYAHRPAAHGTVVDSSHITVTFPDAGTYTGQLQLPGNILWSNNSEWKKVIVTTIDLVGIWASGGVAGPVVARKGNALSVNMGAYHRPTATGTVLNAAEIDVNFPDDKSYTAQLELPDRMVFSNNSFWTKVAKPAAPSGLHVVSVLADPVHVNGTVITVGWTDNSNNESGFRVLLTSGGGSSQVPTGVGATTAGFQVSNGHTFSITVNAWNAAGDSANSNVITVASLPVVPRTITVTKSGAAGAIAAVVKGVGFTAGAVIVIRVVAKNLASPRQFSAHTDGGGNFTANISYACTPGISYTVSAFEDANPTGTQSNGVVLGCP